MRHLIAITLLCSPYVAAGQAASHTISPGMSRTQVVASLGDPATMRTASEYTYLFYRNACGRACGMNDLVILRRDSVVDAIFRSPERHYTGVSSSPAPQHPANVTGKRPSTPRTMTIRKDTGAKAPVSAPAQMKAPAKPNDVRPSIPLNEPVMKPPAAASAPPPAPAKKPSP